MNRWLTCITDAFIGVADSHGAFLCDFEKFPADKVNVIRNGIDCDRFRPNPGARSRLRGELGLADDTPLIGIVAALRNEKNHGMLVQSAAKLRSRHPDAHWVIVGDGPQRSSIEALAAELQIADRIHLLGTRFDTPDILSALDVFTLCSLNEASPVSILESLACGVPVVATNVGSVGETVLEDVTGLLIDSEDIDAMTAGVDRLLRDADLRSRLGRSGRELVLKTGSLASMVDGYQSLMTDHYDRHATTKNCTTPAKMVAANAGVTELPTT
jgi:glycosyltransferase involved in cell wall biosynthesis